MRSKTPLIFVLIAVVGTGCAGTRTQHLSANDFIRQAEQIEQLNSACWTKYIGCSWSRAYLEYGDVITLGKRSRTVVLWTELEGLPPELAKQLKAGNPPWVPCQDKADDTRQQRLAPNRNSAAAPYR